GPPISWASFDAATLELHGDDRARFDLILISYPLHRSARVAGALAGFHDRLAPGRLLLLVGHCPDIHADFVHGAAADWWALPDANPPCTARRAPGSGVRGCPGRRGARVRRRAARQLSHAGRAWADRWRGAPHRGRESIVAAHRRRRSGRNGVRERIAGGTHGPEPARHGGA